jgi:hypothetical protein
MWSAGIYNGRLGSVKPSGVWKEMRHIRRMAKMARSL